MFLHKEKSFEWLGFFWREFKSVSDRNPTPAIYIDEEGMPGTSPKRNEQHPSLKMENKNSTDDRDLIFSQVFIVRAIEH